MWLTDADGFLRGTRAVWMRSWSSELPSPPGLRTCLSPGRRVLRWTQASQRPPTCNDNQLRNETTASMFSSASQALQWILWEAHEPRFTHSLHGWSLCLGYSYRDVCWNWKPPNSKETKTKAIVALKSRKCLQTAHLQVSLNNDLSCSIICINRPSLVSEAVKWQARPSQS